MLKNDLIEFPKKRYKMITTSFNYLAISEFVNRSKFIIGGVNLMALIKNEIPVLEYDSEQRAVIMPNPKNLYSFPKKAVFPFLLDEIETYAIENNCEKIGEFVSITKLYPIYKTIHNGYEICLCQALLGSSASVQILDFLIGYGVKEIISVGSCGALYDFP